MNSSNHNYRLIRRNSRAWGTFVLVLLLSPGLSAVIPSAPIFEHGRVGNYSALHAQAHKVVRIGNDSLTSFSRKHLEDPRRWKELLKYNKLTVRDFQNVGSLKVPNHLARVILAIVNFRRSPSRYARKGSNRWTDIRLNMDLFRRDRVRTFKNGHVVLTVKGGAQLRVAQNTLLILDYRANGKNRPAEVYLKRGRLQAFFRKAVKQRDRDFRIVTPAAIASVRGTKFTTNVDEKGNTGIGCYSGKVEVGAQGKTVVLTKGLGTYVKPGQPPSPPFKLPVAPLD